MLRRIVLELLALAIGLIASSGLAVAQEKRPALGFDDGPKARGTSDDPTKVVTGIPVAQKKDGTPILAANDWVESSPFTGRFSIRTDVGDGVGYTRGFTYAEAMIPLRDCDKSFVFADLRVVNFDQENRWEYNFGVGYRWYSPRLEHVIGVNTFYDMRKTDFHTYHQVTLGWEVLGRCLELRGNGYIVVGAAHHVIGDTDNVPLGVIVNNNFIFQRIQTVEAALGGMDVEFGGRLPFLQQFCPRAFIGFYTYSAEQIGYATGVRGRLEAQLTERVSLHAQIQNDHLFGTTVSGGLAIHFGAPAYRRGNAGVTWDDVLHQRVQRDVNVVIANGTTTTFTGQPVPPPPPPPAPPPVEVEPGSIGVIEQGPLRD